MNPYEEWFAKNIFDKNENNVTITRAAFEAGAASRDAEVAKLKTVPMRYRRMAFNAQLQDEIARLEQENDKLRAEINVLRETAMWPQPCRRRGIFLGRKHED